MIIGDDNMMNYGAYRVMGYGGGGIMMIGILVLLILAIIALSRYIQQTHHYRYDRPFIDNSALNILNERYAKGEISDEEYKVKKEHLRK